MKKAACFVLLLWAAGSVPAADAPRHLTLRQAEDIALAQHPRISVANLVALAAQQSVKESRAAFFPNIYASATAVGVADTNNTRIAAGYLNNPSVFERTAGGLTIQQLITDFGRTSELTRTAKLRSKAEEMNREATREEILLEVNAAYFSALQAQAILAAARQTENERTLVLRQVQALAATAKQRSGLDVSFASVDLDQARLLVAKADNDLQSAFASLSTVLGEREAQSFELAEEPMPELVTNSAPDLVLEALASRPDLARARYQRDAAKEFARAENKLSYPTLSAIASGGLVPLGDSRLGDNYGAAGVNLNIPLFTGGLYQARQREAELQADAADQTVRDQENTIARDTQISKLNLDYSFARIALTASLLQNANQALELAQTRYRNSLSSIVELSQAELNQTTAQIEEAGARYDYHIQRAALDFQLGRLR
ncbi:MAG TPA: TolC family protein [Candidatus Acidoferrum sp.]|nr:TolC family protein [Candidatus Acidoferrum sp.]